MYSQGETFFHNIDDEEFELTVLENLIIRDKEYLITEDFNGLNHIFLFDEENELQLIEDGGEISSILEFWKEEYLGQDDIGDWDDDEYYDREDSYSKDGYFDMDYDDENDKEYF